jgi:FKBP-type peptidyl-prolyl cis-trans isomerase SlyD
MQIEDKRVVTLAYTLKDNDDNVIDKSDDGSFCYLHGASNIIPGLENALTGKTSGDELSVSIPPEQDIEPGMQFHAQSPEGQALVVTIAGVEDDGVTVDGNHPLAGVQLNFDVRIMDVREATSEEIDHGHVHGPGGHQH